MTPEGRIKAKVNRRLAELLKLWKFMPVQSGYGQPALDYVCCVNGLFVMIETKAPGGKMSPTQTATKNAVIAAGGMVLLIYDDATLDTAMEILNGIVVVDPFTQLPGQPGGRCVYVTAEAMRLYEEHLKAVKSGKAPKPAAGGDHGAPRKAPQRRTKPRAGGQDQEPAGICNSNGIYRLTEKGFHALPGGHMTAPAECDCGFSAEVCATNPCLRKKTHLAGMTPGSQWPDTGSQPLQITGDGTGNGRTTKPELTGSPCGTPQGTGDFIPPTDRWVVGKNGWDASDEATREDT